jgi:hypothetical protein
MSRTQYIILHSIKKLKCDDDVIGRNTASMHRGFRPEEGFLYCMRAMTANRVYYLLPSSSALIPMSICKLQCLFSHSFTTYE